MLDIYSGHSISLDHGVARKLGVNAALVLNHIIYWLRFNLKNPKAQQHGKTWMYESQEKMAEYFDFLTEKEIKNAIKILVDNEMLEKENFNKNHFDRTNWYSLPDDDFKKIFSIVPTRTMDEYHPGLSDSPDGDHVYKEERIIKEEQEEYKAPLPLKPEPDKKAEIPKTQSAGAASSLISFKDSTGKNECIEECLVYRYLCNKPYSQEIIREAIMITRETKTRIGSIFKFVEAVCERLTQKEKKSKISDEKLSKEKLKQQEYQRKLDEKMKLPKKEKTKWWP